MILTVPLVGEIKSFPLNETFRMSFGAPTFSFFVIVSTNSSILPGFLTAIVVVVFRISMDVIIKGNMDWLAAFHTHYPSFSFILLIRISFI